MLAAIGVLSVLAFIVFGIMAIISVFRKNGKAKRNGLISGGLFVLGVILLISSPTPEPAEPAATAPTAPTAPTDSPLKAAETQNANKSEPTEEEWQDSYRETVMGETGRYIKLATEKTLNPESYQSILGVLNQYTEKIEGDDKESYVQLAALIERSDIEGVSKLYLSLGGDKEIVDAFEAKKPKENKPTISKAEFDQIKNGMTYDEVAAIIGGPGEVMSEVDEPGSEFHTIMYMYKGEGQLGANANFMFQGGKLMSKAQLGLE